MAARQLVHPVTAPDTVEAAPGIEREADDHRIVDRCDMDVVARQDVEIIFRVVQHLQDRVAFQKRFQGRESAFAGDLFGLFSKHVVAAALRDDMAQRDVTGVVGAQGQANADQVRPHRVERAGFRIDGHDPRGMGAGDPVFEPVHAGHGLVGGAVHCRHVGRRLAIALGPRFRALVFTLHGIEIVGPVGAAAARIEAAQQAGEAMLFEEGGERFARHFVELHVLERDGKRAILLQRHENAAEFRILAMLDQPFLELGLLHVRRRIERSGERAVLRDQLAGGLGADAEDAGNIVHRIAHQRQHVPQLLGRDAEFLDHFVAPDALRFHRVEHVDAAAAFDAGFQLVIGALADQLHQVLVRTDDRDIPALARGGAGIAGDHIVRLDIGLFDDRQGKGAGGIANQRKLRHQILGRIGAVGLVLIVEVVAEGMARLVEDDGKMRRPVRLVKIVGQLPQHGRIAVDRADRRAFRIGQRGQAMIGTKDIGRSVDKIEMLFLRHIARGLAAGRGEGERFRASK